MSKVGTEELVSILVCRLLATNNKNLILTGLESEGIYCPDVSSKMATSFEHFRISLQGRREGNFFLCFMYFICRMKCRNLPSPPPQKLSSRPCLLSPLSELSHLSFFI